MLKLLLWFIIFHVIKYTWDLNISSWRLIGQIYSLFHLIHLIEHVHLLLHWVLKRHHPHIFIQVKIWLLVSNVNVWRHFRSTLVLILWIRSRSILFCSWLSWFLFANFSSRVYFFNTWSINSLNKHEWWCL